MKKSWGVLAMTVMMMAGYTGSALAADNGPKNLGKFGDWSAYVLDEKGNKTCWLATSPVDTKIVKKSEKSSGKRDDVFFMLSHRPKDKVKDEVSYFMGAKANATPIEVTIKGSKKGGKYELSAKDKWAWFAKRADEESWVKDAGPAAGFTVKTTYAVGSVYEDEYSLKGFGKAYGALKKACYK